jgi:hypothetical protein
VLVGDNIRAHNDGVSAVTLSSGRSGRWAGLARRADPAYLALSLADAVRWLGWCLMKALVGGGALVCGDPRLAEGWRADLRAPRTLRRELLLRREVARGIAQLEDHLSGSHRPAGRGSRRSPGPSDRTSSDSG